MTGKVVQVGVAHHLLVGYVGSDQAVAIERDVAHRMPAATGNSIVRLESSLLWLCIAEPSRHTLHRGEGAGAQPQLPKPAGEGLFLSASFQTHLHPLHSI